MRSATSVQEVQQPRQIGTSNRKKNTLPVMEFSNTLSEQARQLKNEPTRSTFSGFSDNRPLSPTSFVPIIPDPNSVNEENNESHQQQFLMKEKLDTTISFQPNLKDSPWLIDGLNILIFNLLKINRERTGICTKTWGGKLSKSIQREISKSRSCN